MKIRLAIAALVTATSVASAQFPYIELPAFTRTFNSSTTRGWQAQAPCDVLIQGVQVPNETMAALQSAAVFHMSAKAPAFSASTILTPSWTGLNTAAGAIMPVTPAVRIPAGDWIGVLGACHASMGSTMANSYGSTGPFGMSQIGGQPSTIFRLLTQTNLSTLSTAPLGTVACSSEDTGVTTRVEVYIVACCGDNAAPTPGSTVNISCEAGLDAGLSYALALSLGQGPIPIDTRQIDLSPDALFQLTVLNAIPALLGNAQGVLNADGMATAQFNLPNIPALVGTDVYAAFVTINPASPSGISSISPNFAMKIS